MPQQGDEHSAVLCAVKETVRGVQKMLRSLHSDLHGVEVQQAREGAELRTRLEHVETECKECREQRASSGAAVTSGKTAINVQLIATVGAVLTSIAALVAVLLK